MFGIKYTTFQPFWILRTINEFRNLLEVIVCKAVKDKDAVKVKERVAVALGRELLVLGVVLVLDWVGSVFVQIVTFVHPIGWVSHVLINIVPNAVLG